MQKILLATLSVAFCASTAFADQCAYVSRQQARDGAQLLRSGSVVLHYCEPCNDAVRTFETVRSATANPQEDGGFWGLRINGKNVDMAYVFLKTATNTYTNLAGMVGCPTQGVTSFLTPLEL